MEQPGERRVQSGRKNREQVRSAGKVVNRCSERSQTPLDVSRGLMSATMRDTGREAGEGQVAEGPACSEEGLFSLRVTERRGAISWSCA